MFNKLLGPTVPDVSPPITSEDDVISDPENPDVIHSTAPGFQFTACSSFIELAEADLAATGDLSAFNVLLRVRIQPNPDTNDLEEGEVTLMRFDDASHVSYVITRGDDDTSGSMHVHWSRELGVLTSQAVHFNMGEWYVLSFSWSNVGGFFSLRLADVTTSAIVNETVIDEPVNMG